MTDLGGGGKGKEKRTIEHYKTEKAVYRYALKGTMIGKKQINRKMDK